MKGMVKLPQLWLASNSQVKRWLKRDCPPKKNDWISCFIECQKTVCDSQHWWIDCLHVFFILCLCVDPLFPFTFNTGKELFNSWFLLDLFIRKGSITDTGMPDENCESVILKNEAGYLTSNTCCHHEFSISHNSPSYNFPAILLPPA